MRQFVGFCDLKWSFIGIGLNILHIYSCYVHMMTSSLMNHTKTPSSMDNQVLRPAFSEVLPTEVVTGSYAILTGSDEHGMKK